MIDEGDVPVKKSCTLVRISKVVEDLWMLYDSDPMLDLSISEYFSEMETRVSSTIGNFYKDENSFITDLIDNGVDKIMYHLKWSSKIKSHFVQALTDRRFIYACEIARKHSIDQTLIIPLEEECASNNIAFSIYSSKGGLDGNCT